jgi:hypothetical protein
MRTDFTNVHDKDGNEYVCETDLVKGKENLTAEDLKECLNEAQSPHPYAGG